MRSSPKASPLSLSGFRRVSRRRGSHRNRKCSPKMKLALNRIYEALSAVPRVDTDRPVYSVGPVPDFPGYFVGKDSDERACLLITVADRDTRHHAPIRLERLENPPARSVNGLFGELFLIRHSRNPWRALAAWRVQESSRFDFSSGDI